MNEQLRQAIREVEVQILDGRGKDRSFGEGVNAWNAWQIIKQALDGIPGPEPAEKPAKKK